MILLLFRNATTRLSQDLAGISPEFCHQSRVPGYLTPEKAPCYLKNYATESTGKAFDRIQIVFRAGAAPRAGLHTPGRQFRRRLVTHQGIRFALHSARAGAFAAANLGRSSGTTGIAHLTIK